MVRQLGFALVLLVVAGGALAQSSSSGGGLGPYSGGTDMTTEANGNSAAVQNKYGSTSTMNNGLAQPLSTGSASFSTTNGATSFQAPTACPASDQYLQLTMFPQSSGDLAQIAVDWDPNFTGSYTSHLLFAGPFAAICNNGVIHCDPGTFNNCTYSEWTAANGSGGPSLGLTAVSNEALGACYCINNYCGSNLALTNAQKVLSDLGGGITHALNTVYPRLTIANSQFPDATQEVFFGNNSGCGTDSQPEQYQNNVAGLQAAGTSAASDPTSEYAMTLNAGANAGNGATTNSCSLTRGYDLASVSKNQVIQVMSRSSGATSDCGSGCVQLQLGTVGDNYWNGGGCSVFTDQEQIQVAGGQYVTSATLIDYDMDDWGQVLVNSTLVWADPASWTSTTAPQSGSCETGRHLSVNPGVDLTAAFQQNGYVSVQNRTSVGGNGEGWSVIQIHVNEGCQIQDTYVSDACGGFENNSQCALESETVDGVQTVVNFESTGLEPVPSSRDVSTAACDYGQVTNPWWGKQRVYVCKTGTPPNYDFQDAVERFNSVNSTLNTTNGNYTDRTVTQAGGTPTFTSDNAPLPPAQTTACAPTCEVDAPGMGATVGDQVGATNTMNSSGNAGAYSFRQCTGTAGAAAACPVNPGETIISACSCRNDFGAAASAMQTIRASSQDTICTTQ